MDISRNWPFVINLGNSIIGAAVLTMPFCFQKCGIVLCMLVLLFCTWLTLTSCQLLMKAGITARRKSYEFLAYHTHGAPGKFFSEVGLIGFQLGTLITQIVVIGDLGPSVIMKAFGIESSAGLRTTLMILLCLTIGLPMALIKDIQSVSRVSAVCVTFYCIFVLYVLWLAVPNLWLGGWYHRVSFWRPQGFFQSLPILSFCFGCQTQLFLLYEALPEPSPKAMSSVVSCAVNLCAGAYLLVGLCGYIAFYSHDIPGDVIGVFPNTFFTDLMKVCFVFSIVITFPVIIFPCRASIYTLLFAKKSKVRDGVLDSDIYIPAKHFKVITFVVVMGSAVVGILIPNVEFILGMNGAIMGTLICYIFPALFYLKVMGSKPEEKSRAQLVLFLGVAIMLVSTFTTLSSLDKDHMPLEELAQRAYKPSSTWTAKPSDNSLENKVMVDNGRGELQKINKVSEDEDTGIGLGNARQERLSPDSPDNRVKPDPPDNRVKLDPPDNRVTLDPPDNRVKLPADLMVAKDGKDLNDQESKSRKDISGSQDNMVAAKAKEHELQEKEKKQDELLARLEQQRIEQEKLIEEQKKLLKELKEHHENDMKKESQQQVKEPDVEQHQIVHQQQQMTKKNQQQQQVIQHQIQVGQVPAQTQVDQQQRQQQLNQQLFVSQQQPHNTFL